MKEYYPESLYEIFKSKLDLIEEKLNSEIIVINEILIAQKEMEVIKIKKNVE